MCIARLLLTTFHTCSTIASRDYGTIHQACSVLEYKLPGQVFYPGSAAFERSVQSYAYMESRLRPTCIVGPKYAEDVGKVVRTLTKYPSVEFAVRSGGHNTNKGFANVAPGITIDLAALNEVEVNDDESSVSIGAGARWEKVYATVEQHDLSVQGGRVSSVGTGGYITGGTFTRGIGYYSPDKGWACDSVTNYDIVLANGSLIQANAQSNPDLFKALKGGSNNFGIVTRFDLETINQGHLTSGTMNYGNITGEQVIDTLTSFKQPQNFDKYAMLLAFFSYDARKNAFAYSVSFYHARPEEYFGSTLEAFTRIKPQTNASIPVQNNTAGFFAKQQVFDPVNAPRIYMHWTCIHFGITDTILHRINTSFRERALSLAELPANRNANLTVTLVLQSVPAVHPGNSLGFDPGSHPEEDQVNLLIMFSFTKGSEEDVLLEEIHSLTKEFEDIAREEGTLSEFIYLNYAGKGQKVFEGYGNESVEELKKVAAKYDPEGVFQVQVKGGFKLSDVLL